MSRSRMKRTPAVEQALVAYVRAGSFPHVAAEAAGVPPDVFAGWLTSRGHRDFARAVRQAHAQARAAAEIAVHANRPLDWLKSGPGRPLADQPGWTAPAKADDTRRTEVSGLEDPEVQAAFARLLDALEAFPEARAAAGAALNSTNGVHRRSSSS